MAPLTGATYHFLRRSARHVQGDDVDREEEQWNDQNERLLQAWAKEWYLRKQRHDGASLRWQYLHYTLSIPATILPMIIAGCWGHIPPDEADWTATVTMTMSSILSGLLTFLEPAAQVEKHAHASHRYSDLVSDIEEILTKERCFRADVDLVVQGMKMRSDALLRYSPPVRVETSELSSSSDDECRGQKVATVFEATSSDSESELFVLSSQL